MINLKHKSSKIFQGVSSLIAGTKNEVDTLIKSKLQQCLNDLDLVSREEFEAVKSMAEKARLENDRLSLELQQLNARISPE